MLLTELTLAQKYFLDSCGFFPTPTAHHKPNPHSKPPNHEPSQSKDLAIWLLSSLSLSLIREYKDAETCSA